MTLNDSIWLFQTIQALGITVWASIAAANNMYDFRGSQSAIGITMSMAPLHETPRIKTPLLARAVAAPVLQSAALLCVLTLQLAAALSGWVGSYALTIGGGMSDALPWLNAALSSLALSLFAMHLGGLWFAYWIRQEAIQLTHITLLSWIVLLFFLFNTSWS